MPKTNKKLSRKQQEALGIIYTRRSIIFSSILSALGLFEIGCWLSSNANSGLGLIALTFLIPVCVILFLIACYYWSKGRKLAPGRYAKSAAGSIIISLVLFFVALPLAKNITFDKWQCQVEGSSGESCQQVMSEVARQAKKLDDISYADTHIKAYVPSYSLKGYTHYTNVWHQTDQITVPYSILDPATTKCPDPDGQCGYSVLSRNDITFITSKFTTNPLAEPAKSIGNTRWGASVTKYLFATTDSNGYPEDYVTKLNSTYILVQVDKGTLGAMSNSSVISILNSVKRVN